VRRLGADGKEQRGSGVGLSQVGLLSARPAATAVQPGFIYYATDNSGIYRSDGANWLLLSPGTQLDYAQITVNTAAISVTTEATAAAIITGNSVTYDGTAVKVEFFAPLVTASVSGTNMRYVFLRDTTVIGQTQNNLASGGSGTGAAFITAFDAPSAGAHTYKISAFVTANSMTVNAGAGGSGNLVPAYLRVTKA